METSSRFPSHFALAGYRRRGFSGLYVRRLRRGVFADRCRLGGEFILNGAAKMSITRAGSTALWAFFANFRYRAELVTREDVLMRRGMTPGIVVRMFDGLVTRYFAEAPFLRTIRGIHGGQHDAARAFAPTTVLLRRTSGRQTRVRLR